MAYKKLINVFASEFKRCYCPISGPAVLVFQPQQTPTYLIGCQPGKKSEGQTVRCQSRINGLTLDARASLNKWAEGSRSSPLERGPTAGLPIASDSREPSGSTGWQVTLPRGQG